MSITVKLPVNFNLSAIYRFVSDIVSSDRLPLSSTITLDFDDLNQIDGTGLTALSSTVEWLMSHHVNILFKNNHKTHRAGIHYIDSCGFFKRYLGYSLGKDARPSLNTLPCQSVAFAAAHGWLEYRFSPWMATTLCVDPSSLGTLRTCLKEVFNNIGDHSAVGTGFIHVQHYPGKHSVGVTVSDFGVGIPGSMIQKFPELSHAEAIFQACEEGVTSKSRATNMGVGLSLLSQSILASQGAVRIHSLSGYLHRWIDAKMISRERYGRGQGIYPGTLIDLQLDTRLFVGDDEDREDVEW